MIEIISGNIEIDDSFDRIDFVKVREMLGVTYWSKGISIDEVKKGAVNSSLVTGAYTSEGLQVGYLRLVSDRTRFAYFMDVVVDKNYRKNGIAARMVKFALEHPDFTDVYQWHLKTLDAHAVYKKVGFVPLSNPEDWMEMVSPRPKR
jgi:GNAT superfamily N-acetyltransferase